MASVQCYGQMEHPTKASGTKVKLKAMEDFYMQKETNTQAFGKMINQTDGV